MSHLHTTRVYLLLTGFISQQELGKRYEESKITFGTLFSLEKAAQVSEHRPQPSLPSPFLFLRASGLPSDCCLEAVTTLPFICFHIQTKQDR